MVPEPQGPWFAQQSFNGGGQPDRHSERFAAWLAMRRGGSDGLVPHAPDWREKSLPTNGIGRE